MKIRIIIFAAVLLSAVSAWGAERALPNVIAYQSALFDDGGNPIADGEALIAFRIRDAGGALLYEEYQTLDVVRGTVSALVGNGLTKDGAPTGGISQTALDPTGAKYLEVQVGDFPPTSAMEIATVPYASYSELALGAIEGAIDSLAIADGSIAYEDLSDDLKSKLTDDITGGRGADQIIYRDELESLYRGPESASAIGLRAGLNYSGANDLQGAIQDIDRAVKRRDEKIDTETDARVTANTTLQRNIDNEADARSGADQALQANINNETNARISADVTLQTNIGNEADTRSGADATLQGNIDAEVAARQLQDNSAASIAAANLAEETASRAREVQNLRDELQGQIASKFYPSAWGSVTEIRNGTTPVYVGGNVGSMTMPAPITDPVGIDISFASPLSSTNYAVIVTSGTPYCVNANLFTLISDKTANGFSVRNACSLNALQSIFAPFDFIVIGP